MLKRCFCFCNLCTLKIFVPKIAVTNAVWPHELHGGLCTYRIPWAQQRLGPLPQCSLQHMKSTARCPWMRHSLWLAKQDSYLCHSTNDQKNIRVRWSLKKQGRGRASLATAQWHFSFSLPFSSKGLSLIKTLLWHLIQQTQRQNRWWLKFQKCIPAANTALVHFSVLFLSVSVFPKHFPSRKMSSSWPTPLLIPFFYFMTYLYGLSLVRLNFSSPPIFCSVLLYCLLSLRY